MKQGAKRFFALSLAVVIVCAICAVSAFAFPTYKDALADGHKYTIYTTVDKRMALEATSSNIQISASNWGDNQTFTISKVSGEWYKIVASSGKVVDVYGGSKNAGTNVFPCAYNGGDNQLWKFVKNGDGYSIQSKLGTFLDVANAGKTNGTNVWSWPNNNQCWYLEDVTSGDNKNNFRFWDSDAKAPIVEIPYSLITPQSKTPVPMLYVRAGETLPQTIQVRGKWNKENINDVSIEWAQDTWAVERSEWSDFWKNADKSGISVLNGNFKSSGGANNVGLKTFAIVADSGAGGLYRARVVLHTKARSVTDANLHFYIYVAPAP